MTAKKDSLRGLAAKLRRDGLAATNFRPVAGRIAELDPELIHASGFKNRIDISHKEIGLVPLRFRSLDSFMRPFVQMPRGFCHLAMSDGGVDYKTH